VGGDALVVNSSRNVGIGISNPSYPLHISKSGSQQLAAFERTDAGQLQFFFNAGGNNAWESAVINAQRARTSIGSPSAVIDGDDVLSINGAVWTTGSTWLSAGGIIIEAAGTSGAASAPGRIVFNTTPVGSVTSLERLRIESTGNLGIGTTSPYAKLSVVGGVVGEYFHATSTTATSSFLGAFSVGSSTPSGRALLSVGTSAPLILVDKNTSTVELGDATAGNIIFQTNAVSPNIVLVGIGTTTPDADVNIVSNQTENNKFIFTIATTTGDVINRKFTVDSDGDIAYDGSATTPADYAEAFTVVGQKTDYEPGDFIALSLSESGKVEKSSSAYQTNLVGVYSTRPGIIGTLATDITEYNIEKSNDIPVAVLGRVPAKVSTENGPIKVGDRITSSSVAGIGMKASQGRDIVGLALEEFDGASSTTAKILLLVNPVYATDNLAQATSTPVSNNYYSNVINQISGGISNVWKVSKSFVSSLTSSIWNSATSMLASASKLRIINQDTDSVSYETYNVQSARSEITISGSDVLVSGNGGAYARIRFDESFASFVDENAPVRVIVTPTMSVASSLYVYSKDRFGFEVRSEDSADNAKTFDWIVIARRAGDYDPNEDPAIPSANYGNGDSNSSGGTISSGNTTTTTTTSTSTSSSTQPTDTSNSSSTPSQSLDTSSSPEPSSTPDTGSTSGTSSTPDTSSTTSTTDPDSSPPSPDNSSTATTDTGDIPQPTPPPPATPDDTSSDTGITSEN